MESFHNKKWPSLKTVHSCGRDPFSGERLKVAFSESNSSKVWNNLQKDVLCNLRSSVFEVNIKEESRERDQYSTND